MQHRNKGRILGRVSNQRKALLKGLIASLVIHNRITTTEAKAKEMKNFIDQLVNKAKRSNIGGVAQVAVIRMVYRALPSEAAKKMLTTEFINRFSERTSGYARVVKMEARKGDGARMAVIEFVA